MLIAGFLFATMNVFVKMLPNIPAVEIVFFRSLISFVMSFVYLKSIGVPVLGNNKKLLVARGAVGAVALTMYFYTLQNIPLGSAVTMQFLSPIFTSILGIFIVKERVHPKQWIFYVMAFVGLIIIQGFDPRISIRMFIIGISASIFAGLAYNIIRKIKMTEHPLVIVFYFPLVTTPLTGLYSVFNWEMPVGNEWLILLAIGVLTQFAQYFMTMSYQAEDLSKVASLKYLTIVYALGYGYVFFDESYNWIVFSGIFLILLGVILNVWFKNRIEQIRKHK
ncbi:EamA domain-containing membrane protein RarD [Marivirga sericea]|uniref:EamA domain-containing membrane protein RarD n=2 Tax=Marivirga sericea TaxID=1028 RepID=A0A1X7KGZ8_9BACT|nr:EamA domain-containing membrane protein RarD [Marivirga sericea]